MSDTSKRRARKSKLVPRDYVDIEDEKNNKMQESPKKIPKIILKPIDELTTPPSTESSMQFNVQVEVESCDDDNLVIDESYFNEVTGQNDNGDTDWAIGDTSKIHKDGSVMEGDDDESLTEYMKFLTARTLKFYPPKPVSTIPKLTTEEILNEANDILENADHIADKILSVEVKNIFGRLRHTPNKQDKHEDLIQEALESWMKWFYSKLNDPPLFYKCYICEKAWWELYDFREHIRNHRSLNVDIEAFGEQCCVAAYVGKPDENKQFSIDSDCWRCGKDFDSHLKPYYECGGCMLHFKSCLMLAEHEGACLSYWYENNYDNHDKQDIDIYQCPLCAKRLFSSYTLMMKHMLAYHTVRSDRCTLAKTATCAKCDDKYIHFFNHYCRSKCGRTFCEDCDRRFSSKILYDLHQSVNKKACKCKICDVSLETQCKEAQHMLTHTDKFIEAFRCSLCYNNCSMNTLILKRNSYDILEHLKQFHKSKRMDSRIRDYDSVIIPVKLTQAKGPEIVKVEGAVREIETNEQRPTKRVTKKPSIIRKSHKSNIRKHRKNPNNNGVVLTSRLQNDVTKNIIKYTAIYKTNENKNDKQNDSNSGIRIRKFFSNFNENDESNDNGDVKVKVFEHTISNNSNNENKQTNNDINATTSNTDIVIKQEINTDEYNIDENKQIDNITDTIEKSGVNIGIKIETNSDNANNANEINTYNGINADIDSNIKIKDEVLDDEYEDPVNYDITIEETDISLSKVFRVSDSLKELASKITVKEELYEDNQTFEDNSKESNKNIKEEFDADMLKDAVFEEIDDSNMFEPEVLINGKNSKNQIYYCICGDFKGTFTEFRDHEGYCDDPVMKTYPISKKLTYMCVSCDFVGTHAEFKDHEFDCFDPMKVKRYESHYCSKCMKDFGSMKDYLVHLKLHGVKKKCCPHCCIQLGQYTDLKNHILLHVKSLFQSVTVINKDFAKSPRVFQCKLCKGNFKTVQFFAHWEKHLEIKDESSMSTKASPEKVPVCDVKVLETGALKDAIEYLQKRQRGGSIKACVICRRFFERQNDVKRHIVEHLLNDAYLNKHKNGALTCQICGDMFRSAAQYKCHMRDHGDLPVFKCEICNKYFSDSSNFAKHKKIHNIDVFQCELCKKRFQVKTSLSKHMELHIRHPEPLKCMKCVKQKIFYDFPSYRKHMRTSHNESKDKYICKICRKRFPSLKEKWDHEWEAHKERKVVSDCPICKASFRKYLDVKNHMKTMHGQEWTRYSASLKSIFHNTVQEGVLEGPTMFIDKAEETLVVFE